MTGSRGPQPVLTGWKVVLRPWTGEDADDVFAACQDPDIQTRTTVPSPYTRDDAVAYVSDIAAEAWQSGGAVYAVLDAATGELAGGVGAHEMRDGIAHVGYWAVPAARGRGLTADALRTLARWFLSDGGAVRVELVVEPANTGSVRVADAAGFVAEEVLRQRLALKGRHGDVVMYSLLSADLADA